MTRCPDEHRKPRGKKAGRRERRAAVRHGFGDLAEFRQWLAAQATPRSARKRRGDVDPEPS
jgi:hypothetical protein